MNTVLLIARRELGAYLRTMSGYVIIAVMLFIDGLLFNAYAAQGGGKRSSEVLADFFTLTSGITLVGTVFLSMRLIAEERQTGTIALLYSAPVLDVEIVLGKFLASLAFLSVFFLATLYMPALVAVYGKVAPGHIAAGYLGLLLVGSAGLAIGTFELLVCLPIVLLLIHDSPAAFGLTVDHEMRANGFDGAVLEPAPAPGMTLAEALRSRNFWMLAISFSMGGMAVFGVLINSVQILGELAGLPVAQVAAVQAMVGVGTLAGRVSVGYALDRTSPRAIGAAMFLLTAFSIAGYSLFHERGAVLAMAFLLGFSIGGEADILPYLISRFFGVGSLGRIYGVIGACFAFGMMLGPIVFVWLAAATGSMAAALQTLAAGVALGSLAFVAMGKVPPLPDVVRGGQAY